MGSSTVGAVTGPFRRSAEGTWDRGIAVFLLPISMLSRGGSFLDGLEMKCRCNPYEQFVDKVGPCIILAHSSAAQFAIGAALRKTGTIKAICCDPR